MSSVENLGRRLWAQKFNGRSGESSFAFQIRLDLTSDHHLSRLAKEFEIPKATLAQEILRAGINDIIVSNPYATTADVFDAGELQQQGLTGDEIISSKEGRPLRKEEV